MKSLGFFLVLIVFGSLVFSQTRESDRLLQQSFETVYSNPDESLKVAQHLIKSSEDSHQKAEAYLLSATANYTKGNYEQALTDAFEARNRSAGKKNSEVFAKSTIIISDILKFLQLNDESEEFLSEIPEKYMTENHDRKGLMEIESLIQQGENYFLKKQNDSSVIVLEKALQLAKRISNPFLQLEIHQKLSANFLAVDNQKEYHAHNQEALSLRNITTRSENNISNTAHQLINHEKDKELSKIRYQHSKALWILLGIAFLCFLVKIILFFRNRNKLRTYGALLNYLNKENSKEKQIIPNQVQEEASNENQRTTTILKESEDQILQDLQKFESSKRFINKDMSLGMLAAQLNTNTKYLSEIINRHKEKNFNSYINELRINYITEKIKTEPAYLNYKVSYLAEECGFASHSTFTTVFKSVVGVSPITFVEFIKKEINNENEVIAQ